ncbi:MAG: alpha/beta hydrolase, partial [Candidatus Limnocylindria bacterium]
MPLSPIPSRVLEIGGDDGRSIPVTRWDGDPDLVAMLLLPTREALTRGYDRYGSALAERGVTVMIPARTLEPGEDALATVERLLQVLGSERFAPPLVLAGHGIGGLLAADYLGSARPQPDLAVLIGPELGVARRTSLIERVLRRKTSSSKVEAAQARVAAGLHEVQVRTRVEGGGQDEHTGGPVWLELLRSVRPGDGSVYPALGHDKPNEPGWRDRVQEMVSWIHRAAREQWPDALPPAPDGDRWRRMPRADATAAHDAYVATENERLARFRDQVARRGGPKLTPTREGMLQLGTWLLDTVEVGARDVDAPGWASAASIGPVGRLSSESVWLIDGAATHVAASLRSLEPTLHWELCTDRIDANYQRTVLAPIHLPPPVPATAIFRQLTSDAPNGEWLAEAWDAWIEAVELVRRNPHAFDVDPLPLDEVAVDPYDGDPWNAQIWIPEGAETVLGTERFRRLGDRIGRLKGVEELAWEDREVMLIRVAPGIDPDDLRRRVVTMLRRARKAAA